MSRIFFIFFIIIFTLGCFANNSPDKEAPVKLLHSFKLDVPEPSGLTFDYDGTLWCVSDKNGKVYNLDTNGTIIKDFNIHVNDLEGITVVDSFRLAVVSESKNLLVLINREGEILAEEKIKFKNKGNSGFEGLSYNNNENVFFILNEKEPGAIITVDEEFKKVDEVELGYLKDYSGIYYHHVNNQFWIVSHESKKLLVLSRDYEKIVEFKFNTPQMEGITLDLENKKLYIVSDPEETLFVYDISNL